jgi:hypothetical protein
MEKTKGDTAIIAVSPLVFLLVGSRSLRLSSDQLTQVLKLVPHVGGPNLGFLSRCGLVHITPLKAIVQKVGTEITFEADPRNSLG